MITNGIEPLERELWPFEYVKLACPLENSSNFNSLFTKLGYDVSENKTSIKFDSQRDRIVITTVITLELCKFDTAITQQFLSILHQTDYKI